MLEQSLRGTRGEESERLRRGARIPPLAEALAPLRARVRPEAMRRLTAGLTVLIGIEALIVLRDMWGMDAIEAERTVAWAARALVRATFAKTGRKNA